MIDQNLLVTRANSRRRRNGGRRARKTLTNCATYGSAMNLSRYSGGGRERGGEASKVVMKVEMKGRSFCGVQRPTSPWYLY